ncbi:MAG: hypothetical protein Q8P12_04135, partial [bacterium]|nr:hypothetical protein [bacterium]
GLHDSPEEELLNGWTIRLYDEEWSFVEETVTSDLGNKGQYRFDVAPGTYNVCEVIQAGWIQTGPILGAGSVDNSHNPTGNGLAVENQSGDGTEGPVCWQAELEDEELDGWLKFGNRLLVLGIGVVKDASTDVTVINTSITYTLIVSNTGETTLDILVTDDPPEGFAYVLGSATVDGIQTDPTIDGDGNLIWLLEDVAPGQDVEIVYEMFIEEDLEELGIKQNIVTVSSGELKEIDPADVLVEEGEVLGCTDPEAENYDPEANQDDESCEYPQEEEEEGEVLGEETENTLEDEGEVLGAELPETGSDPLRLAFAASALMVGIVLRRKSTRLAKQKA